MEDGTVFHQTIEVAVGAFDMDFVEGGTAPHGLLARVGANDVEGQEWLPLLLFFVDGRLQTPAEASNPPFNSFPEAVRVGGELQKIVDFQFYTAFGAIFVIYFEILF